MGLVGVKKATVLSISILFGVCIVLLGCHSPYVNATVENKTGGAISPIEVDYPSASFGTETLAAGATFKYRFKVLGSGGTKVVWTDAAHQEHTVAGPSLHEGAEGTLSVVVLPAGASWTPALKP
jgi:hypothetical protein